MSIQLTLSFSEAVNFFLRDCKFRNLTPTTYEYYKFGLRIFEQFLNESNLEFASLTPSDIHVCYMNYLQDRKYVSSTIRGRICACQVFFKFLWQEKYLQTNLAADLKLIKAVNTRIFTFSTAQVTAILSLPDQTTFTGLRDYAMMLLLLETGMRVMELTNMQIIDLDYSNGSLRIPSGKGRKPRIVPIQLTCLQVLDRYLRARGNLPFHDCWVTLNNTPLRLAAIKKLIINYCKTANVKGTRGSAHTFRHTMAKCYLLNGGDVFSLMHILGHTNIEMTQKYVDLFNPDLQKQHKKASLVESLLSNSKEKEVQL